jgi:hypothetical protein
MITKKLASVAAIGTAMGLSVTATSTQAATLTSLVITGGTFQMGVFTPAPNVITDFSGANLIDAYNPATWDTTVAQIGPAPGAVMAWDFNSGGVWANAFTAASVAGVSGGGPVPSGDVTGSTLTLNLSALFVNWKDSFNQGNVAISGTASGGANGTFTMDWTSLIVGGPFDGQIGTYNVSGTYAVVPVPAAAWLLGSGLIGLVGVARRRRKTAA